MPSPEPPSFSLLVFKSFPSFSPSKSHAVRLYSFFFKKNLHYSFLFTTFVFYFYNEWKKH
jgi:hypothetical protein